MSRKTKKKSAALGPEHDAIGRALAEVSVADPLMKIGYLVPHPVQDLTEASPIGWYTPGLHTAAEALRLASVLPADIREPFTDPGLILILRQQGLISPMVTPISIDALADGMGFLPMPFRVIFTVDEKVAYAVDSIRSALPLPVLHFSKFPLTGRRRFDQANVPVVCQYVREVITKMAKHPEWAEAAKAASEAISSPLRPMRDHPLPIGDHNVVSPNESALVAFGRRLHRSKRISIPMMQNTDRQVYIDAICESVDAVTKERDRLLAERSRTATPIRLMLAVNSAHWSIHSDWKAMVQSSPRSARKGVRNALSTITRGESYFDRILIGSPAENEPAYKAYFAFAKMRSLDAASFTAGLGLLSTRALTPVVRLEPRLNAVRGHLKFLANCSRHNDCSPRRQSWKLGRLARNVGSTLRSSVDKAFLDRIDALVESKRIEGVKLVTDLPLELLPVRGLPLGLRFDVSRLSPIPGNLFLQQCTVSTIELTPADFNEVLVVRSFKASDSLRLMMERGIDIIQARQTDTASVTYRFVDVQTEEEFVEALSGFRGAMMIFDGHGTYEAEHGVGTLVIGDLHLDAWSLRKRCTVPPIVMFSACDTHPMDGSHSSVAMAALSLGAVAVLGTSLPIQGDEAAVFNARMALRIHQFIPAMLSVRGELPLTWRTVVSGLLRMSHTVEILRILARPDVLGITYDVHEKAQLAANMAINSQRGDWYEVFEAALSAASGVSAEGLRAIIDAHASLTDAMKYVHLGNPENILIVTESVMQRIWNLSANAEENAGTDQAPPGP